MGWVEALGMLAGLLTTVAYVPQAVRTYRTRETRDLSLRMLVLLNLGLLLWLAYGALIGSLGLILANAVTFALSSAILAMKLRFG